MTDAPFRAVSVWVGFHATNRPEVVPPGVNQDLSHRSVKLVSSNNRTLCQTVLKNQHINS